MPDHPELDEPEVVEKIDAPKNSYITIHGKVVPGNGATIKFTNQPAELAKISLTRWASVEASWAQATVPKK